MSRIAVVYATWETALRATIRDQLFAFRTYSGHECVYVNASTPWARAILERAKPDVVIFHTLVLSTRWSKEGFALVRKRLAPLRGLAVPKAMLPQDEFLETDALCDFAREFGVTHIFSVAPESEWPKLYGALGVGGPRLHRILTGYLDDATVARIARAPAMERRVDIGYRSWHAEPWLGRHGQLKVDIARRVEERAPAHGLSVDISTAAKDVVSGDEWLTFLAKCRFTLGVEGGASILDRDGSIRDRTRQYVQDHPVATFEEVEQACFPGLDGGLSLTAISPRHLEACATRTGQILIEGAYNDILKPGIHYLPLKADFSNLDEVLAQAGTGSGQDEMIERAYHDVVGSGRYSTRGFVREVLATMGMTAGERDRLGIGYRAVEPLSWGWLRLRSWVRRVVLRPLRALRPTLRSLRSV